MFVGSDQGAELDLAGFDGMEFFVGGRLKKVVREHRENPFDWVRCGIKQIKKTQLRYHGGITSSFELVPALPAAPKLLYSLPSPGTPD